MEPVTHVLAGACLARAGLNRRAAYCTLTMAIAAEFPDIDTLWSLRGPVEGFQHHRGITHTFLGLPFEAAIIVAGIYGWHCWRARRPRDSAKPLSPAPVRWGMLYGFALLALLSHLALDFTNNYGIRPFFPFNPHWYAASIVFIVDPLILLLLLTGLVAPALFGLIGSEVGAKRGLFRGRGWAQAALLGVVLLWTLRAVQHSFAVDLASAQTLDQLAPADTNAESGAPVPPPLPALRVLASPDIFSPFRWYTATDFGSAIQLAQVSTLQKTYTPDDHPFQQPERSPALQAAMGSPLGRAYLDWSPMPMLSVDAPVEGTGRDEPRTVTFRDPRFVGGIPIGRTSDRAPLSGEVQINSAGKVISQSMDGREER